MKSREKAEVVREGGCGRGRGQSSTLLCPKQSLASRVPPFNRLCSRGGGQWCEREIKKGKEEVWGRGEGGGTECVTLKLRNSVR